MSSHQARSIRSQVGCPLRHRMLLSNRRAFFTPSRVPKSIFLDRLTFGLGSRLPHFQINLNRGLLNMLSRRYISISRVSLSLRMIQASTRLSRNTNSSISRAPNRLTGHHQIAFAARLPDSTQHRFQSTPRASSNIMTNKSLQPTRVRRVGLLFPADTFNFSMRPFRRINVTLQVRSSRRLIFGTVSILNSMRFNRPHLTGADHTRRRNISSSFARQRASFHFIKLGPVRRQ